MPMECITEEEIKENLVRTILEEKRSDICKYLNASDHYDFLRSKRVLTQDDQETIKGETTQRAKAGKLLDIIVTKGSIGYECLVLSIQRNKTQTFLVQMLNKEFETRKNAYVSLLKDKNLATDAELKVDTKSLPTPGVRKQKLCVESIDDGSITPNKEKDLDQIWIRKSYLDCSNDRLKNRNHHDKECGLHHSDA